jgi:hypothetical protein
MPLLRLQLVGRNEWTELGGPRLVRCVATTERSAHGTKDEERTRDQGRTKD